MRKSKLPVPVAVSYEGQTGRLLRNGAVDGGLRLPGAPAGWRTGLTFHFHLFLNI